MLTFALHEIWADLTRYLVAAGQNEACKHKFHSFKLCRCTQQVGLPEQS